MNKVLFYIVGMLFCVYGLNVYVDIAICLFLLLCLLKNIDNDQFYYFYFAILFFEFILCLPKLSGSVYRIYELVFFVKILKDIKNKKMNFSLSNILYIVFPFTLILTSFLYCQISTILSLTINLCLLSYMFTRRDKLPDFYDNLLFVIGLFGAFSTVYGLIRGYYYDYWYFKRLSFTISDPNYSSILLNIGFFAIINNKTSKFIEKLIISLLCLIGLILTVSLSAILCFIIILTLYLFVSNKKIFKWYCIALVASIFIFLNFPISQESILYGIKTRFLKFDDLSLNSFTSYRLELFVNYIKYFFNELPLKNILFGGLNTLTGSFSNIMVLKFKYVPHNSYIDVLYMTGILGFIIIYGLIFYNMFKKLKFYVKNNCSSAISIFLIKLIVLFYCTNLSIFPYRYFFAFIMLYYNDKIINIDDEFSTYPLKSERVLWLVNTIFPFPSKKINSNKSVYGGWLTSLYNMIVNKSDIQMAIVTTYTGRNIKCFVDNSSIYYLVPCKNPQKYDRKLNLYFEKILTIFKPQIIHIHGTEYAPSLSMIESNKDAIVVTSIQGLTSVYADVYTANISNTDIIKNITLRDIMRNDNLFIQKQKFTNRAKFEVKVLKETNYVIGRTNWDYANILAIDDKAKYLKCNEILRASFYTKKWDIKKCKRHSIFFTQALYPIKGLHFMIKALYVVKKFYPDVKLQVAGRNIFEYNTLYDKIKISGYAKYIRGLIKKYNLNENIIFLGTLSEEQIKNSLLSSHIYVQSSSIENSSNALGEAMLLGLPIVASNVGGTSDLLIDKSEGLLYPYTESAMLANCVIKLFKDDNIALEYGNNARIHALKTHNPEDICHSILKIYEKIKENK